MKKPIKIMDTIFRDASQSKVATRMRIEDMLPIAEKLDQVGYHSVEIGGEPHLIHASATYPNSL
jgi:pyruvate/oxaloacetate carboxyltransferase